MPNKLISILLVILFFPLVSFWTHSQIVVMTELNNINNVLEMIHFENKYDIDKACWLEGKRYSVGDFFEENGYTYKCLNSGLIIKERK